VIESPSILFGIETGYGIARDGVEDLDVVAESIALVRSAMEPGARIWGGTAQTENSIEADTLRIGLGAKLAYRSTH